MGISGLLPLLKDASVEGYRVEELSGLRVGVDISSWLHKAGYGCALELAMGQQTTRYIKYCTDRLDMLDHFKITPVVVFDGRPLPMKSKTNEERKAAREENLRRGHALMDQGQRNEAIRYFQKAITVNAEMTYKLIEELKKRGVEMVVSPYEADAQLAYMSRIGLIDTVITEDSDLLAFGCRRVLLKMDRTGEGTLIELERVFSDVAMMTNFSYDQFLDMCILSGCDYLASAPGVGTRTAHKYISKHRGYRRAIQCAKLERVRFPQTYVADFERARRCFLAQTVFDPRTGTLARLSDAAPFVVGGATGGANTTEGVSAGAVPSQAHQSSPAGTCDDSGSGSGHSGGDDDDEVAGPKMSADVAKALCSGELCPKTLKPYTELKAEGFGSAGGRGRGWGRAGQGGGGRRGGNGRAQEQPKSKGSLTKCFSKVAKKRKPKASILDNLLDKRKARKHSSLTSPGRPTSSPFSALPRSPFAALPRRPNSAPDKALSDADNADLSATTSFASKISSTADADGEVALENSTPERSVSPSTGAPTGASGLSSMEDGGPESPPMDAETTVVIDETPSSQPRSRGGFATEPTEPQCSNNGATSPAKSSSLKSVSDAGGRSRFFFGRSGGDATPADTTNGSDTAAGHAASARDAGGDGSPVVLGLSVALKEGHPTADLELGGQAMEEGASYQAQRQQSATPTSPSQSSEGPRQKVGRSSSSSAPSRPELTLAKAFGFSRIRVGGQQGESPIRDRRRVLGSPRSAAASRPGAVASSAAKGTSAFGSMGGGRGGGTARRLSLPPNISRGGAKASVGISGFRVTPKSKIHQKRRC